MLSFITEKHRETSSAACLFFFFLSCGLATLSRKKNTVLVVHAEARIAMVMFLASC